VAMAGLVLPAFAHAQGVDVTAHISVQNKAGSNLHASRPSAADVVVWLTPLQPDANPASMGHPGPFRLAQKDKMFIPHLLVVPAGSSVEFPNEDPFFHNVFSLFNGKRFDLGLYESGTSRVVRFDKPGVSYIFCNIHPEMGAIVVVLNTPYWGVSSASGVVSIRNVPPGSYRMHVWSETARSASGAETERLVPVGAAPARLGEIALEIASDPMLHHKNKFGEDYPPEHDPKY
jgi:plastocyanin